MEHNNALPNVKTQNSSHIVSTACDINKIIVYRINNLNYE